MTRLRFKFLGLVLIGCFLYGLWDSHTLMNAAVIPNACPQYTCKDIQAYWDGVAISAQGFYVAGGKVPVTNGYLSIFATVSNAKAPLANPTAINIDVYSYPVCVPTCGMDMNMVWQAPQEVSVMGAGMKGSVPIMQQPCTALAPADGGIAPQVTPPKNMNTQKNTPPGYTTGTE